MPSTLEEIAKLLPQEQAERFLTLVAQFKNVPDDDEYLQLLEAIGFMTLLWKEVPNEIKVILDGANPVSETCHSVGKLVREAVVEAIPSYEDLKSIVKGLEEHELALKRSLSATPIKASGGNFHSIIATFVLGLVAGLLLESHLSPLIPWSISSSSCF